MNLSEWTSRRTFVALAGAAAAFPRVAFAQAAKVPRVAICSMGIPTSAMILGGDPNVSAFLGQMVSHGFVEGRTIVYDRYLAPAATAAEVVRAIVDTKPDVIFFDGSVSAGLAARALNVTVPMVAFQSDVVGQGLVDNPARPEGNLTGISGSGSPDVSGKILNLLREAVPSAKTIAYVTGGLAGKIAANQGHFDIAKSAATRLGVSLVPILVEQPVSESLLSQAFRDVVAVKADAVQFGQDVNMRVWSSAAAQLALAAKLPAISPYDTFAPAGGLLSYSADSPPLARKAADYVVLILAGAKPRDLPVVQATVINLVVNLKTANAIGVTIPTSLLAQAAEVIQ